MKKIISSTHSTNDAFEDKPVVVPIGRRSGDDPDAASRHLLEVIHANRDQLLHFLRIRLGSEAEAQDVAQDAIVRLLQRKNLLRDHDIRALLFVTARNLAIDRLRAKRRIATNWREQSLDGETDDIDDGASPERSAISTERLALIELLLRDLSEKCRKAFVYHKLHEMEYAEIARLMGISESMVRKYILKAIAYCAARIEALEAGQ